MSGMVWVLELLVMSHTIHIDRAKEKTYRNLKGIFLEPCMQKKIHKNSGRVIKPFLTSHPHTIFHGYPGNPQIFTIYLNV